MYAPTSRLLRATQHVVYLVTAVYFSFFFFFFFLSLCLCLKTDLIDLFILFLLSLPSNFPLPFLLPTPLHIFIMAKSVAPKTSTKAVKADTKAAKVEKKVESSSDSESSASESSDSEKEEKEESSDSDSDSDEEETKEVAESAASSDSESSKRKADAVEEETPVKKSKTEEPAASATVFVGGLSWNVDNDWLRTEFTECGEILDVRVITDRDSQRSKG